MVIQKSDAFTALIRAGIEWLGVQQDPAARCSHLGVWAKRRDIFPAEISYLYICPSNFHAVYRNRPIVVLDGAWSEDGPGGPIQYHFTDADVMALAGMITEAGGQIASVWNGAGSYTVTFALWNEPHPSLVQAVKNNAIDRHSGAAAQIEDLLVYPVNWR